MALFTAALTPAVTISIPSMMMMAAMEKVLDSAVGCNMYVAIIVGAMR